LAKRYARVLQTVCLVETIIQVILILLLKFEISELYTNVEGVRIKVEEALVIIAFGQFVNQT
jgi:Na+-driven multidrug efflux pump